MNARLSTLQYCDYIGDGVYVGFDGYQIWLLTEREHGIDEIALDNLTIRSFFMYFFRVKQLTNVFKDIDLMGNNE